MRTRLGLAFLLGAATACGGGNVSSTSDAKTAYLGIDPSIDKAIQLGFVGFNAASSANIPTEMASGAVSGSLVVTGQVDQGSSPNKTMRLNVAYAGYADASPDGKTKITYDSASGSPVALNMDLKGIPTGTLSGSYDGTLTMTGDLKGPLTLSLTFTGQLQSGSGSTVERKPGTTHITGTATSPAGTYAVDVTR